MQEAVSEEVKLSAEGTISAVRKPQRHCSQSNLITDLCLNPQCKSSMICDQEDCKYCGLDVHEDCSTIKLTRLTNLINGPIEEYKKFVGKIKQIEHNLIEQMQEGRNYLTDKYPLGNMLSKYHELVDQIYHNQNKAEACISGKQAEDLYRYLMVEKRKENTATTSLLDKYSIMMEQMTLQILEIQRLTYEQYVNKQSPKSTGMKPQKQLQTLSDSLKKVVSQSNKFTVPKLSLEEEYSDNERNLRQDDMPKLTALMVIEESKILSSLDSNKHIFLHYSLGFPKKLKLLFRASEHRFKVQAFHKFCDDVENTLTVVRTEFGKTVAGFTHYPWNFPNKNGWVRDSQKKAFLLQLDLCQKFICENNTRIIYCNKGSGPRFGNDLIIREDCNTNRNSYTDFPRYYNLEGESQYCQNQESYSAFCGSQEGNNFIVEEYQVFEVVYQKT